MGPPGGPGGPGGPSWPSWAMQEHPKVHADQLIQDVHGYQVVQLVLEDLQMVQVPQGDLEIQLVQVVHPDQLSI